MSSEILDFNWKIRNSVGDVSADLNPLDHHCDSLTSADTCCGQSIPLLPALQLVKQRKHQARTGSTQRMTQRNRSAIHVGTRAIQPELLLHGQVLGRERLVHFNEIDIR
jgi:hypothetical protein